MSIQIETTLNRQEAVQSALKKNNCNHYTDKTAMAGFCNIFYDRIFASYFNWVLGNVCVFCFIGDCTKDRSVL